MAKKTTDTAERKWNVYVNVLSGRNPLVITNKEMPRPFHSIYEFKDGLGLDQIEDMEAEIAIGPFRSNHVIFDDRCTDDLKSLKLDTLKTIKVAKFDKK